MHQWEEWAALRDHALRWTVTNPGEFDAWFFLGRASDRLGENDDAIAYYEHALSLDRDHANGLRSLGLVYERVGRTERALDIYERIKGIDPLLAERFLDDLHSPEQQQADRKRDSGQ